MMQRQVIRTADEVVPAPFFDFDSLKIPHLQGK
jgi:hypothetical protein